MTKIKVGIVGYGNLGRGLVAAIQHTADLELVKIFTRRNPDQFSDEKMARTADIQDYKQKIDVLLLALGSATDIPTFGPELAAHFNTVDTYDNHGEMLSYYDAMDKVARAHQNTSLIGMGWDPGLFSLNRALTESLLPTGKTFTFWGKGVSQGHSDALRRIDGVRYAVQYTIPKSTILNHIDEQKGDLKGSQMHDRQCFIVADKNADKEEIREQVIHMKDYFEPYHTEVNFITEEEFRRDHQKMPHGGHVIRVGETGTNHQHASKIDFSLTLESNPEFTASVAVMGARAVYKMNKSGTYGAKTILDTPPSLYSSLSVKQLINTYL